MQRVQEQAIIHDLEKKMVFLVGPRQVGKTWLAKSILQRFEHAIYLNYDSVQDKVFITNQSWIASTELIIFDELDKMPDWKNYLKGVYDTKTTSLKILVTGSARLETYHHMGDSLAGRYFLHRLLPISLAELAQTGSIRDLDRLLIRGGFPEPYFSESVLDADRWRIQYINSILSTDVFEFERIHNMRALQLIFKLLRARVGSPVSYQSLSEDAGVSPTTVKQYIQVLEALFIIFRVTPYSKNIARSLLKEPKIYFFDTALVDGDEGAKLENLVAVSLLKHVCAKIDYHAQQYALHYLRTKEGIEVDFALTLNEQVEKMIEVKLSDKNPSKSLLHFHKKYEYPGIQLVKTLHHEYQLGEISILKADRFLATLFL